MHSTVSKYSVAYIYEQMIQYCINNRLFKFFWVFYEEAQPTNLPVL